MPASTRFPDVARKGLSLCETERSVHVVWGRCNTLVNYRNEGVAMESYVCDNWNVCTVDWARVSEHNVLHVHGRDQAGAPVKASGQTCVSIMMSVGGGVFVRLCVVRNV